MSYYTAAALAIGETAVIFSLLLWFDRRAFKRGLKKGFHDGYKQGWTDCQKWWTETDSSVEHLLTSFRKDRTEGA